MNRNHVACARMLTFKKMIHAIRYPTRNELVQKLGNYITLKCDKSARIIRATARLFVQRTSSHPIPVT